MKFRETTPKRQNITKEVSDYHEHKINLQKDFVGIVDIATIEIGLEESSLK